MSYTTAPVIFYRQSTSILYQFCTLFVLLLTFLISQINKRAKETESYHLFPTILTSCAGFLIGNVFSSFILAFNEIDHWKRLYKESWLKCLEYIYSIDVLIFISVMFVRIVLWWSSHDFSVFVVTSILSLLYHYTYSPSLPEVHELREKHKLNIGYGAAMFYYHNYLKLFIPQLFLERVRHFSNVHEVNVQERLIILIPQSCKTKPNLDENPRIDRSRELLPLLLNIAGIKNRVYNITVYQIFKPPNGDNMPEDSIWQAVEYAQPLNDFYDLYSKQQIKENEMFQERQIFIQTLQNLLNDADRSHETVLLLPYDDTDTELDEAQLILNQYIEPNEHCIQ